MRFNESQFFFPVVIHCSSTRTYATRLCRIQIRRENKFWFAYKYELEWTSYFFTTTSGHSSSSNFTHFFCSLFISFPFDALVLCSHFFSPRREGRVAFSTLIFFFSFFFNSLFCRQQLMFAGFIFAFSALTWKLNWICKHNRTIPCIVFRGITPLRYTAIRLGISHRFLSKSVIVWPQKFVFMCAARNGTNTWRRMNGKSFLLSSTVRFLLIVYAFSPFFFLFDASRVQIALGDVNTKDTIYAQKMWYVMGRTRNIFVGIW